MPRPTIAQVITLCIVLPVFFFTYTYFVISAYLAELCTFIFRHYGRSLELFFGSYNGEADRCSGGDLDRAHGGDHRRPVLL